MIFTKISAHKRTKAFTLVEAMVVMALLALISVAILRASIMVLKNAHLNRNKMAAVNMMQCEAIQGMSYNRIGIHPGDNIGFINSNVLTNDVYDATNDVLMSTSVALSDMGTTNTSDDINGTLITYVWNVDDAFDGTGASDADGDTNDYKRIRVQITWDNMGIHYTNFVETIAYGIYGNDSEPDIPGPGTNSPPGGGDPGVLDVTKAEYQAATYKKDGTLDKASKLKVEATEDTESGPTLNVAGYGTMTYDAKGDKYKYDENGAMSPGPNVNVTSSDGASGTRATTFK